MQARAGGLLSLEGCDGGQEVQTLVLVLATHEQQWRVDQKFAVKIEYSQVRFGDITHLFLGARYRG